MRSSWLVLGLVACSGSAPHAAEPPAPSPPPIEAAPAEVPARRAATALSLDELAAELRALRAIPGHFGGGEWNDDVDRSGGRKVEVLGELGARLGDGTHDEPELAALGPPDVTITGSAPAMEGIFPRGADPYDRLLVFYWRGGHDFLYFQVRGTRIVGHAWWNAGE